MKAEMVLHVGLYEEIAVVVVLVQPIVPDQIRIAYGQQVLWQQVAAREPLIGGTLTKMEEN